MRESFLTVPRNPLNFFQFFWEKITDSNQFFLYLCKYNKYNAEKFNKTKPI